MSEEKAEYVTAAGNMRAALATARVDILSSSIPNALALIQQIDDALAMTSPGPDPYSPMQVQRMIREAYDEGKTEQGIETASKLIELPEHIKTQSLTIAELTNHIEALRMGLAISKNQALELVLSATEEGKPKFSNENQRKVAVEQLLRADILYIDNIDALSRKECGIRKEQIQLDFLHNSFSAFRAIAGMQGVK